MEKSNYGKGNTYQRQDGHWVIAVCSRSPATNKSIRHYGYGKTKPEALQKKMGLLAKSEQPPVIPGLTAKSI